MDLIEEIEMLKKQRRAIILAHVYEPAEIQEIADFSGDSFALSQKAAATDADVIVFCGVRFMAETANILSPQKITLLPAADAGCQMFGDGLETEVRQASSRQPPKPGSARSLARWPRSRPARAGRLALPARSPGAGLPLAPLPRVWRAGTSADAVRANWPTAGHRAGNPLQCRPHVPA